METFTYQTAAYQKGISKEGMIVANNWANRPEDERFTSLNDLIEVRRNKTNLMRDSLVNVKASKLKVIGEETDSDLRQGKIFVEYFDEATQKWFKTEPTNWGFNQVSSLGKGMPSYFRTLPATLAADCIYWGISQNRAKQFVKSYANIAEGSNEGTLSAMTGPDYGRIYDYEVAQCVRDSIYNTDFKIPGALTGNNTYDPFVPVTKATTTLFASDRDIFLFLVDDKNPIEVGKLKNGDPDLMFRGFYVSNSEVGAKSFRLGTMYLRGVCMNRCLWGVENFQEIKINHTKFALDRFRDEAAPALRDYSNGNSDNLIQGVENAKAQKLAKDDEEMLEFLQKRVGLSQKMSQAALDRHQEEEDAPVRTTWDTVQAITAIARDIPHQDNRFEIERKAGQLLDKVTA